MSGVTAGAPRLLIISHDVVGTNMAGPGIRYYHLARVLGRHVPTTLAAPVQDDAGSTQDKAGSAKAVREPAGGLIGGAGDGAGDGAGGEPGGVGVAFAVYGYRRGQWATLADQVAQADVCLFPSDVAHELPQLAESRACLVVDGYDPLMAEWLALSRSTRRRSERGGQPGLPEEMAQWRVDWHVRMEALARQYRIGDFFICASERQRDWWLGLLEASGRINPATFDADPSLRRLVDVVPYGLPEHPLPPPKPSIKGVWPGVEAGDRLALWGGGLWPWLDPLTAIRAVALLRERHPRLKLVFPGTRHPNPQMAGMPNQVEAAKALAAELSVMDTAVCFGDWAPYADWPHVLQESDVALTLHFDTVETRLAFRSRVLEYIWAGLPIVATAGDATSDLVAGHGLGVVTPVGDVPAVAAAIDRLLAEPRAERAAAFAAARAALSWERAAEPLVRFCRAPVHAADRVGAVQGGEAYVDPTLPLRAERDYWRGLAEGYANGRVMRALNWMSAGKRRVLGR